MSQENRYQPPKAEVADLKTDDTAEELATRGARFGGAFLDGLITLVIIVPIMFFTGYWQNAMKGVQPPFTTQLGYGLLGLVAYVLLQGYFLHTSGQTIGKRAAGTRIVSVDDNRILPLWKVIALRQLPISIVSLVPVFGGFAGIADVLFIFRRDRRCLHDLIAGTKVINANREWKAQIDAMTEGN
jgi:uncharacterized RDD family membrane protein YckC